MAADGFASRLLRANLPRFLLSFAYYVVKHSPVWLLPLFVSGLINAVLEGGADGLREYRLAIAGMAVLFMLNIPFQALHIRTFSRASRGIEKELRSALIRKMQELSISFYRGTRSGALTAKFLRDVEAIELALKQATMSLLPAVTSFIYVLSVTSAKQPLVSAVFVAALPLMWLVRRGFAARLQTRNRAYRLDMEQLSAKVNESIEMLPVARAHALEDTEIEQIESYFERINRSGLELDVSNAVFGASTWVILQLFTLSSLGFSAWLAVSGRIPLGDIVLYQGFFTMISNALSAVFNVLPILLRGRESYRSVSEVLDSPDLEMNRGKPPFPSVDGAYRFENFSFTYPQAPSPALIIQALDIPAGQSVGIVGPSGGGKTTLINCIIGFLRASEGDIFLNGHPYSDHDLRSMRRHLSVVGQEAILFSGSIRENIAYGNQAAAEQDSRILSALQSANAWEFVSALPRGIDSSLAEHGANLSGGQRQRLVLARAFFRDPKILIFDEATSALDSRSELQVQNALERISRNRTTFIVAHRLSTVRNVDRILVLSDGRIVEDGSPADLLGKNGLFAELAAAQGLEDGNGGCPDDGRADMDKTP
jgi:ATP-binding cassette subfamily B protein